MIRLRWSCWSSSGDGLGVPPGVLIDAETDAAGLEKRCVDMVRAAVVEQIAEDGVDFDGSAFLQVSVHGRGEAGALGG